MPLDEQTRLLPDYFGTGRGGKPGGKVGSGRLYGFCLSNTAFSLVSAMIFATTAWLSPGLT